MATWGTHSRGCMGPAASGCWCLAPQVWVRAFRMQTYMHRRQMLSAKRVQHTHTQMHTHACTAIK